MNYENNITITSRYNEMSTYNCGDIITMDYFIDHFLSFKGTHLSDEQVKSLHCSPPEYPINEHPLNSTIKYRGAYYKRIKGFDVEDKPVEGSHVYLTDISERLVLPPVGIINSEGKVFKRITLNKEIR